MCGIFAYLNYDVPRERREILRVLFGGLKRLEYRGYDSAGISVDADWRSEDQGRDGSHSLYSPPPLVFRQQGKIDNLVDTVEKECASSHVDESFSFNRHVAIAHTRWATHGEPSPTNSHPQSSGQGHEFLVVHNGIITNYQPIKEMLQKRGFEFESETDTEVIPKLAKLVYERLSESRLKRQQKHTGQVAADSNGHPSAPHPSSPVPFTRVVMEVMRQLDGAYALLFKSPLYPNELVACKRGSPLLLGVKDVPVKDANGRLAQSQPGDEEEDPGTTSARPMSKFFVNCAGRPREYFLASDASAVVEHTRTVVVIDDNEVLHVKDGQVFFFTFDPSAQSHSSSSAPTSFSSPLSVPLSPSLPRELSTLTLEVEQIMKGQYDHYMQKEIHEQPDSLTTTMRGRLIRGGQHLQQQCVDGQTEAADREPSSLRSHSEPKAEGATSSVHATPSPFLNQTGPKGVLLGGLKAHLGTVRRSRRIILIGCGSSFHAALAARPLMEELSGIPVQLEISSDLLDRRAPIYREDTAVFLSQSGETADTLAALEYAKESGAVCMGITNSVGSAIARGTAFGVHLNAGMEIGVASTKAYTSQIAVLTLMALALGEDSLTSQQRREAIIDDMFRLPGKVKEVLSLDADMRSLAQELVDHHSLLLFGRGYNYATALEGALKVKEVALMHSEGILAGEMKHGPLALVDENLPIIVMATRDGTFSKQQSVIQQLQARKGRLIVMCTQGDAHLLSPNGSVRVIEVPYVEDCLQPIINVIPLQLLAYHLTVLRGFNVDQPRNLAKSVTVE